jgi:RNA polymerase sigma factor (sigma-70 family)
LNDDAQLALALLETHGARLHALVYRITLRADVGEDLLQDLFLRLARPRVLSSAVDPVGYAITTAMRLAFDWRRANGRRRDAGALSVEPAAPATTDPLEGREDLERVLDAIAQLPAASRDIVVLRYLESRPYEEIARTQGRSVHQTRALCHKAIVRLRAAVARPRAVISRGAEHVPQ